MQIQNTEIQIQNTNTALNRNRNIDNEKQDTIGNRQKVVAASLRIAGVASVLTIENSVHQQQQQSGIYFENAAAYRMLFIANCFCES